VINTHGDVLTNNHVAGGCRNIWVRVGGTAYPGVLRAKDKTNDLAVVRIAELPVKSFARFSGGSMKLGSSIVVLGYPLTSLLGDDLKATTGNVSGLSGLQNNSSLFQFTAPIQPGNSGGPILDSTGAVAGIARSKLGESFVAKRTGGLPQLVNFGVKSRTARGFLRTHNIPFSIAASNRALPNVAIVSAAQKYTIKILCEG
jgi:S1-C subfamily serine protease